MNSDLPGDLGPLDPGLDQLFRTLTAGATPAELSGEQTALTMFRENTRPRTAEAGLRPGSAGRSGRSARASARWTVRLAGAFALTLAGGLTAAAYADVLPAPVQHLAHQALSFADVPDTHHSQPPPGRGHASAPAGNPSATSPARPTAAPSAGSHSSPRSSASPSTSHAASPSPSPSPSASALPGPVVLTVTPANSQIPAGSAAVIDGQLTKGGKGLTGSTVTLLERTGRRGGWKVAGTAVSGTQGNVTVSVPVLVTNGAFRLTGPDGARSAVVRIAVVPPIEATLQAVTSARDALVVSTQYARPGNIVVLQLETKAGGWVKLRVRTLNANGRTRFLLNAAKLQNRVIRVVLLATVRHAAAVSAPVTVLPPS